jgi:enamine deaminase RidA (YjgF/YER057c/UK114 family)
VASAFYSVKREFNTIDPNREEWNMSSVARFRLFNPKGMPGTMGYSHVAEITSGKIVYVSGQVSRDEWDALVGEEDFSAQVERVFQNLKMAVEAAGGSFSNVVKLNYYCVQSVEPSQMPAVREIRDRFVNTENPPTSTFVFVSRLVRPEFLIEIEALAVI